MTNHQSVSSPTTIATHRTFGDGGNFGFQSGIIGELVDALDGDHGRIHVGDKQLSMAVGSNLDDDVDVRQVEPLDRAMPFKPDIAGFPVNNGTCHTLERVGRRRNIACRKPIFCYEGCNEQF